MGDRDSFRARVGVDAVAAVALVRFRRRCVRRALVARLGSPVFVRRGRRLGICRFAEEGIGLLRLRAEDQLLEAGNAERLLFEGIPQVGIHVQSSQEDPVVFAEQFFRLDALSKFLLGFRV